MTYTVQHKRSAEENRRPRPSQLADGQLALNITDSTPGLFFSTVRGDLVKVGPAHISAKAPSPTNWGNKAIGELWVDTTKDSKIAKFWTGMEWVDAGHNLQFLQSHLEPGKDSHYNLGSASKRWNNLWTKNIICHNKVTVRTLEMTGQVNSSLVPTANNKYELGSLGLRWKNINVVNANISGNVTSRRTVAGDTPETLVTKSYIDELSFELALWKTDGANISPKFSQNVVPDQSSSKLGTDSDPWVEVHATDIFTGDMNLCNESRGGNEVDGSWGSYTIQEGKDDLFLINRRTGKKYTFLLKEVN
jgi:hypothetical protein